MTERNKIIPVTIEMFRPEGHRSVRTERQLGLLMERLAGKGRLRLYLGLKRGMLPESDAQAKAEEINKYVLGAIGRYHKWPNGAEPPPFYTEQFYMQQQKQANGVIEYLVDLLPEARHHWGLKGEISGPSDEPNYLFGLLSDPPDSIDSTLTYESHRLVLLSILAGRINAANLNGRLNSVGSKFLDLFNQNLFEGVKGRGMPFDLESFHHNATNEVAVPGSSPFTAHLKRIPFTARVIKDVGLVHISSRKKDDRISIIKSIATALDRGGEINTDSIKDKIGMMFVLLEDIVTAKYLADRVVSVMEAGPKRIRRVDIEDEVEQDRGQSPAFKFDARRVIWFYDKDGGEDPVPFELIILKKANYLNSILEVGTMDSQTGLYTGMAHDLFDLKRARKVAPVLFPEEVYGVSLDAVIAKQSQHVALDLRQSYRA